MLEKFTKSVLNMLHSATLCEHFASVKGNVSGKNDGTRQLADNQLPI